MAFKKGQSGNPAGKPKGALCAYTAAIREMQQKNEPQLLELFYKRAREVAEQNDDLSGLHAVYKSTERHRGQIVPINIDGTLQEQIKAIQTAAKEGKLTPADICTLMTAVEKEAKISELTELQNKVNFLWEEREQLKAQDVDNETQEMYGVQHVGSSSSE